MSAFFVGAVTVVVMMVRKEYSLPCPPHLSSFPSPPLPPPSLAHPRRSGAEGGGDGRRERAGVERWAWWQVLLLRVRAGRRVEWMMVMMCEDDVRVV